MIKVLNLCSQRNYIRSIIKGDNSTQKELKLKTLQELIDAKVINNFPLNEKIYLKIPEKLSSSIQKRCKNFKKLGILEISMLLQDYSIHIQMLIDILDQSPERLIKKSQIEIVNQGNFN